MILRDSCEVLVEEKFEAIVVRAYQEAGALEVRTPMADVVDETD
jgi:hypothetical protein